MVRHRPWLVALGASTAVAAGLLAIASAGVLPWWLLDPVGVSAVALLVLTLVHVIAPVSPSWTLALAFLAWGLFAARALTLLDRTSVPIEAGRWPMTVAVAEALALLVVAVPVTVLARRAQSRLASFSESP